MRRSQRPQPPLPRERAARRRYRLRRPPLVGAGTWHTETVDSGDYAGWCLSLALTSAGWPAISYYDYTMHGALKYAYKDPSGWHIQTVDSSSNVGQYTSLQLTSTGWPAISYYEAANGYLKYAYKSAS